MDRAIPVTTRSRQTATGNGATNDTIFRRWVKAMDRPATPATMQARERSVGTERWPVREDVEQAVVEGALLRIRPVIMTVAATIGGLLPIMFGSGTGSEVMRRIAAPMVGGMVSATILTLAVIPALFLLWRLRKT